MNWSDAELVRVAYQVLLGREPDAQGFLHHLSMLRTDKSGWCVLRSLLSSQEFLNRRTNVTICDFAGFRLAVPTDDLMLKPMIEQGTYEPYVFQPLLAECVGKNFLDVGANIGVFSVAAGLVTKARVIAIEAAPENAKLIAVNAALNGLDNVTILPVAASDRMEMATFRHQEGTNKTLQPLELTVDTFRTVDVVLALRLDDLLSEPVDVMKIDIEGYEYRALKGAERLLSAHPIIFIEFSPDFILAGSGVDYLEFLKLLFERGYTVTILHRDMTREDVHQSSARLFEVWTAYREKGITHLDLMFR